MYYGQQQDKSNCAAGGMYSQGPISLLSGLNPRPSVLVMHFFMVALFGCMRLPMRKGVRGIWLAFALLLVAIRIILPIIRAEGIRCAPCLIPVLLAPCASSHFAESLHFVFFAQERSHRNSLAPGLGMIPR